MSSFFIWLASLSLVEGISLFISVALLMVIMPYYSLLKKIVSLYINGVYIGGGSTPNTAGQSIYDGGSGEIGTLYGWKFYGRRSAFKMWNRTLSQSDIAQNFNAQQTRFGL